MWTIASPGAMLTVLLAAAAVAEPSRAAFPGENGRIAFTTEIGDDVGSNVLSSLNPDGSGLRQIHFDGVDAAFSPRGGQIAFATAYGFGLRLRRADGRGRVRALTRRDDFEPDWAPGGRRLIFTRLYEDENRFQLRIYHRGRSRALTEGSDPAWSVRGQIAFVRAGSIYVIAPDASGLRRIVSAGASPDWSPDGRRIVYSTPRGVIATARADGSGPRRLRPGSDPAFSPDGHKIVYIGRRGLTIMGSAGKNPRRVPNSGKPDFTGEGTQAAPDWQPVVGRAR